MTKATVHPVTEQQMSNLKKMAMPYTWTWKRGKNGRIIVKRS